MTAILVKVLAPPQFEVEADTGEETGYKDCWRVGETTGWSD
jgi:hypothetical protein